jgi:hypothetical protein
MQAPKPLLSRGLQRLAWPDALCAYGRALHGKVLLSLEVWAPRSLAEEEMALREKHCEELKDKLEELAKREKVTPSHLAHDLLHRLKIAVQAAEHPVRFSAGQTDSEVLNSISPPAGLFGSRCICYDGHKHHYGGPFDVLLQT